MTQMSEAMERCIEACRDCHEVCVETSIHCVAKGGMQAEVEHIRALEDCAQFCSVAEDAMLRGSDFADSICTLCADICETCAESCDKFPDDEVVHNCANHCRGCADLCRELAEPVAGL